MQTHRDPRLSPSQSSTSSPTVLKISTPRLLSSGDFQLPHGSELLSGTCRAGARQTGVSADGHPFPLVGAGAALVWWVFAICVVAMVTLSAPQLSNPYSSNFQPFSPRGTHKLIPKRLLHTNKHSILFLI